MSAFVVSNLQISAIVMWASAHQVEDHFGVGVPIKLEVEGNEQAIADMLLEENIKSVNYRYGEETPITACELVRGAPLRTAGEVHRLCESLAYQSCEHPTWNISKAKHLLGAIKRKCLKVGLEGYDKASWSI